jgi:hypothetical protein
MTTRTRYLLILIFLGLIDIVIPIPILGLILINVIFRKPAWFTEAVSEIYG